MNKRRNKNVLLPLLIVMLSAIYVIQVIELGKINFLLGRQEKNVSLLREESDNLKLAVSKSGSLNNLEEKIREQGYLKVGKIDFLVISASSVAIKN